MYRLLDNCTATEKRHTKVCALLNMKFPITGDEMYQNVYPIYNNNNVPDNNIHHQKQQVLLYKLLIHDLLAFLQYKLFTC